MLTETQYRELLRYRDDSIRCNNDQDKMVKFLASKRYIILYHPIAPDGEISETLMCSITNPGKRALEEFEEYAEKERNDRAREDANQEVQRLQATVDRRKQFKHDLIVAITGSAIGGLIVLAVQNWRAIIDFISNLLQQFSPP